LNSSRVTGSLTLKKRDRSEASRMTKFAMWDAARPMIRPEWRITRSGTPVRIPIRCKRVPPGQKTFPDRMDSLGAFFTGRRVEEHHAVLPEPPEVLDEPDMNDELLMHSHATDVTA
jgi:hypothetical protein